MRRVILVGYDITSFRQTDRTYLRTLFYVIQCEMRHSNPVLQPWLFGGKWDGQLLSEKQRRILKKTNCCIRWSFRQTTYVEKAGDYSGNLKPESNWEGEQTGEMSVENKHVVSKQLASRLGIKDNFADNCR